MQIGENLSAKLNGKTLTIVVENVEAKGQQSASGKSRVIATTRGNVRINGTDLKLGFNLYRPVLPQA